MHRVFMQQCLYQLAMRRGYKGHASLISTTVCVSKSCSTLLCTSSIATPFTPPLLEDTDRYPIAMLRQGGCCTCGYRIQVLIRCFANILLQLQAPFSPPSQDSV